MRRHRIAPWLLAAAVVTPAGAVAPRRLQVLEKTTVERGEASGIAVTEPATLRLAPRLREVPLAAAGGNPQPFVWCQAVDSRGRLYVGTGNEGRVFRVTSAGGIEPFFQADEIEITAMAFNAADILYVAAAPKGRIYRVEPDGAATLFFESDERYIWALVIDSHGDLFAATGDRGIIFQLSADGNPRIILDSADPHVVALVIGAGETLFAGTAGHGMIYRIPIDGTVSVRHESNADEVSALAVGADGTLYAALLDAQPPPAVPATSPDRRDPDRHRSDSVTGVPVLDFRDELLDAMPQPERADRRGPARRGPIGSRLIALSPEGLVRTLWRSDREVLYTLAVDGADLYGGTGQPASGPAAATPTTGFGGAVRRFEPGGGATVIARMPETQVSSLVTRPARGLYAATSNLGNLYWVEPEMVESGTFTSLPIDADLLSDWGRIWSTGPTGDGGQIAFATRTGNSGRPDANWSEWRDAVPETAGARIASPPGRFLQWRVELRGGGGRSPTVKEVWISLQQRNVPPVVEAVRVDAPARERSVPDAAAAGTGGTDPAKQEPAAGRRTIRWSGADPNGDTLVYRLDIRPVGDSDWSPLAADLGQPSYEWDAAAIGDGRYEIRVRGSDLPANPPDRAHQADARSRPFLVDHTAPRIDVGVEPGAATAVVTVTDNLSGVAEIRYAFDDGAWVTLFPDDGIADSGRETARVDLGDLASGDHSLRLRAADAHGNVATERITLPAPP